MRYKMKGKPITRKRAEEILGKEKLNRRIKEAKETFREDPNIEISWTDGLEIILL